jgi:hypothetical protein
MSQEEARVRCRSNGTTAVGEGLGWQARLRREWQKFLTALMRAMSGWAV